MASSPPSGIVLNIPANRAHALPELTNIEDEQRPKRILQCEKCETKLGMLQLLWLPRPCSFTLGYAPRVQSALTRKLLGKSLKILHFV